MPELLGRYIWCFLGGCADDEVVSFIQVRGPLAAGVFRPFCVALDGLHSKRGEWRDQV